MALSSHSLTRSTRIRPHDPTMYPQGPTRSDSSAATSRPKESYTGQCCRASASSGATCMTSWRPSATRTVCVLRVRVAIPLLVRRVATATSAISAFRLLGRAAESNQRERRGASYLGLLRVPRRAGARGPPAPRTKSTQDAAGADVGANSDVGAGWKPGFVGGEPRGAAAALGGGVR